MPTKQVSASLPKSAASAPDASKGMTFFVMIVATLYFGKEVLVPVTLALLLAFILAPLVEVLRRYYLGRIPSVIVAVLFAVGVICTIGGIIGTQIGELSTDLPSYVTTVQEKVSAFRRYTFGQFSHLANVFTPPKDGVRTTPMIGQPSAPKPALAPKEEGPEELTSFAMAERYLSPVLSPLATLSIVFVVAVFALLQREDLRDRLIRLIGSEDLHHTTVAIDDAGGRLSRYFVAQLCINTVYGLVISSGLLVIGVPNPLLWGIISALLRFVPYVGVFIAAFLPMALTAAIAPGWSMVLWVALLYFVVEGTTGQFVEPLVYGKSTGLSPFSVVVAAIFWAWLWGPIGLILSTPLTLCLVVIGRHTKRLEFLDIMLGDRPALTPIESFYQRVLSGDADEAQDHAERLLKDCSLSAYYDEVAIKGMQIAVADEGRGALDEEQLERIKSTVLLLIRGLERYNDAQPAKTTNGFEEVASNEKNSTETLFEATGTKQSGTILSIAGRGQLDDAAAEMLVQLLTKHGLNGRAVTYSEASREQINMLDVEGVSMVCVSYLDITGNPAHLRYLVQRLRQKLPKSVPLLIGIWPVNDVTLADRNIRSTVDADYFTSSLEQAVAACLHVAHTPDHLPLSTIGGSVSASV